MIVGVAIQYGDLVLSMPKPNRHHHILHKFHDLVAGFTAYQLTRRLTIDMPTARTAVDEAIVQAKLQSKMPELEVQGFVDEHGKFLTREQAWIDAFACHQLLPRAPTDGKGCCLYSEDVW